MSASPPSRRRNSSQAGSWYMEWTYSSTSGAPSGGAKRTKTCPVAASATSSQVSGQSSQTPSPLRIASQQTTTIRTIIRSADPSSDRRHAGRTRCVDIRAHFPTRDTAYLPSADERRRAPEVKLGLRGLAHELTGSARPNAHVGGWSAPCLQRGGRQRFRG